jgi:hypothetical protein
MNTVVRWYTVLLYTSWDKKTCWVAFRGTTEENKNLIKQEDVVFEVKTKNMSAAIIRALGMYIERYGDNEEIKKAAKRATRK